MSSLMQPISFEFKAFNFFKEFCKFFGVEVLNQDPVKEKNSNSLILTNLRWNLSHVCST
jgi:hypothetical protein